MKTGSIKKRIGCTGVCTVDGCGKNRYVKGFCQSHYARFRRYGSPLLDAREVRKAEIKKCVVSGCGNPLLAKSMCRKHYYMFQLHGRTEKKETTPVKNHICQIEGCKRPRVSRGLCNIHYSRLRKRGNVGGPAPEANRGEQRTCSVDGCGRNHRARGLCSFHYKRLRRSKGIGRICKVAGCENSTESKGLCQKHYYRWLRHGTTETIRTAAIGDRVENNDGYVLLKIRKDDPYFENRFLGGWIREHRYVMSKHIGRPLLKDEAVHHINGNKSDNRLENLELWSCTHPAGKRPADLVEYAKEILNLYEDQVSRGIL